MLLVEILSESSGMRLLCNPSVTVLIGLLKRANHKTLRGLIVNDNMWWWDADMALHGDVARNLSQNNYVDNRLHLDLVDNEPRFNTTDVWNFDRIMAHPRLAQLVKSPFIYSYEGGYGWLSGPEWITACQG